LTTTVSHSFQRFHACTFKLLLNRVLSSISYNWFVKKRSGAGTFFGKTGGAENIKYKFYFAPKFPSICSINQKCSTGVVSYTFYIVIESSWGSGDKAHRSRRQKGLGDFWDLLPNNSFFGMFQLKFCLNVAFSNCFVSILVFRSKCPGGTDGPQQWRGNVF